MQVIALIEYMSNNFKIEIFFYIYIIRNKYKMVKICVFDTETTGLPPILDGKDWNERNVNDGKLLNFDDLSKSSSVWKQVVSSWPSIIQLGYIIYDTEAPNNSKIFSKYIDIPDNVIITESSIKTHHIDKEKIRREPAEKKALIEDALAEFMNDIMNPDIITVIGHNVQFDRKAVIAELLRLSSGDSIKTEKQLQFLMDKKNFTCTMEVTAPICNIQMAVNYKDKKTGEDKVFYKVKSPRLVESYQYYFGYSPDEDDLHDALIDVILTLRVFIKYKYNEDVCGKNEIITDYIEKISPQGYVCNLDKAKMDSDNIDIENIKLEMIDPFYETETLSTTSTTSTSTKSKSKSKKGGRKNKKQKAKTKRRRSKRLLAAAAKLKKV
jgi:DNA polymerase III epsilon subunit-like protein